MDFRFGTSRPRRLVMSPLVGALVTVVLVAPDLQARGEGFPAAEAVTGTAPASATSASPRGDGTTVSQAGAGDTDASAGEVAGLPVSEGLPTELGALPAAPPPGAAADQSHTLAPLQDVTPARQVDDSYVVVLREGAGTAAPAVRRARQRGIGVQREFRATVPGFVATLDARELSQVRRDPDVAFVEPDQVFTTAVTQQSPPWGIDRTDQRTRPLSRSYTYLATGAGVTAYVLDTGVLATHSQLSGRVVRGYSTISDGRGTKDCNGHGTHVAGIIGGRTYGVAKGVRISPVRVLNCSGRGTTSGIIAGLDWVARSHNGPSVANLSLVGSASTALDSAVRRAITSGVTVTVAAGNTAGNACKLSPARVPGALTVGAVNSADSRDSRYSAYGSCLDLFAPGTNIRSASHRSTTGGITKSGTSMASPFVAGAAALYLQRHRTASPSRVRSAIVTASSKNVVTHAGSGSPNRLLNARSLGAAPASATRATTTTRASTTTARATTTTRAGTTTTGASAAARAAAVTRSGSGTGAVAEGGASGGTASGATAFGAADSLRTGPLMQAPVPCSADSPAYEGSLARTGASAVEPGSTYYSASVPGVHRACLTGPDAGDFDLQLYRWEDGRWTLVAGGIQVSSTETVAYRGAPGYYYWRVVSYRGSGSYHLVTDRP